MRKKNVPESPAVVSEPVPEFANPIEFLYGEHERIRRQCDTLSKLAGNVDVPGAAEIAASVLNYFESNLPQHVADEEEDLFPMLMTRCAADETLASAIKLLSIEHKSDVEYGRSMLRSLRGIAAGRPLPDPDLFADYVRAYAMLQRRHHAMENSVVLPAADHRLGPDDKAKLARGFALRRGVTI